MSTKTLNKYVVIVDAVNVTTGKKANGSPVVTRLLRGSVINAPADHPSVVELLAMNGVADEATLVETAKRIQKGGNAKFPTIVKDEVGFRLTGKGVTLSLGAEDDPVATPDAATLPIEPTAF